MNIAVDDGAPAEEEEVSADDLVRAIQELQKRETPQSLKAHLTLPAMRALYQAALMGDPGKRTKLQIAEELFARVGRCNLPLRIQIYTEYLRFIARPSS